MMPWIAAAIIASGVYQGAQARKSRSEAAAQQQQALAQQASDAAKLREQISRQTEAYNAQATSLQQQAETARQQFDLSAQTYRDNKLAMENRAKEIQSAADEERRKAAASEASALRARTRGGRRSLLSGERMDAELGVGMALGGGSGMLQ